MTGREREKAEIMREKSEGKGTKARRSHGTQIVSRRQWASHERASHLRVPLSRIARSGHFLTADAKPMFLLEKSDIRSSYPKGFPQSLWVTAAFWG
ncbi:hypothetical protein [Achromobacter animicus]|uniref:hypothetical protein n=1 Tax=Achromobacter animicus TaxID=1389935 RepID=UPI00244D38C9|nr:hypothetical protein [Achromobacter animicus]MDH0683196.1 hypothetical protein [Achromobacter animicus]